MVRSPGVEVWSMVDKPNQYKQALSAVGSAFGSHEEPFETSGYATLGEGVRYVHLGVGVDVVSG